MRVLIVDDSVVFRSQIRSAIEGAASIEIVGTANNGKIAIQKLEQSSVDLITLDMEMPEMGGVETIKAIRAKKIPVRIVVFSSYTTRGSEATLEALAAGADDFVAKPTGEVNSIEVAVQKIRDELLPKINQFISPSIGLTTGVSPAVTSASSPSKLAPSVKTASFPKRDIDTFSPLAIVIGSSTGGPPALEKVLFQLPVTLRCPIFIAQHMPPIFTASLAKRLSTISGIVCAEGFDGEKVENNRIYIAPGDFHMTVVKDAGREIIKLDKGPHRNSVRPAVDNLFESIIKVYGSRVMAFVLTGMGEDGMVGCRAIKESGGGVAIQNRESCVVFGMPGAVFQSGAYDEIYNLETINQIIKKLTA